MELLSPFALLWLGLLGPLVVLYILKRRRQERTVGSTLLWEAALRDLRAERPFRRLVPHVSLILQALALIAGAVALSRPVGAFGAETGARVVAVVDTSASMAAADVEGPRIERVRDELSALARSLSAGGEMMVIEAGPRPLVRCAATADQARLRRAVSEIGVAGGRADLAGSLALAFERTRAAPDGSRIVVFTDAGFDGTIPIAPSVPVEVRRIAGDTANTAIVAADARPRPGPDAPDRVDVFLRLARYGSSAADVFATVSAPGRGVVASRRTSIPPDEVISLILSTDLPPDSEGRALPLTVEIERADGQGSDGLTLDDRVAVPNPTARRLPVFLVGDAGGVLQRVFASDSDVELYATSLQALTARGPDVAPLDGLHVFVGETPAQAPQGDVLVVAPTGNHVFGVALGPEVDSGRVVTWQEQDALLRFVSLEDVHLGPQRSIEGAAAQPLVITEAGTAIGTLQRPDGVVVILAFDPVRGNLAGRADFVVLFRNLLEQARARRAEGGIMPGTVGEPLRIPAADGEAVAVRTPAGGSLSGRSTGGVAIVQVPPLAGVFEVEAAGRSLTALRNLLDPMESDLRARGALAGTDGERDVSVVEERIEHRELWPALCAALLILLGVEAWWTTRRGAA